MCVSFMLSPYLKVYHTRDGRQTWPSAIGSIMGLIRGRVKSKTKNWYNYLTKMRSIDHKRDNISEWSDIRMIAEWVLGIKKQLNLWFKLPSSSQKKITCGFTCVQQQSSTFWTEKMSNWCLIVHLILYSPWSILKLLKHFGFFFKRNYKIQSSGNLHLLYFILIYSILVLRK